MQYSVQPRDRTFVKGRGFLSLAKNMGKKIGKSISKNLSGKYSQKILDHAKQSARDVLKTTSKRVIQKTAEATGDIVGNKIAVELQRSQKLRLRIFRKLTNVHEKEIPKKKDIHLQKKDRKLWMI